MQPISDMPGDDFMKLQSLYAADLPINAECTLEDARQVLNWLLFEAPKDETSERVRYVLDRLLLIVTGALVSHRTDAERDDQVLS
jgi:hypothetical protein